MTDRYAVVGNPIGHSKSPEIHAAFALETGQEITYEKILAPLDAFITTVDAFVGGGACGINVTLPFKVEAYQYATYRTPRSVAAGAANTLRFEHTTSGLQITADNTDGVGLVRDICINLGHAITNRRVLVLGAGGAARGVVGALLDEQPASISISNRTVDRAHDLVNQFKLVNSRVRMEVVEARQLAANQYDVIINATAASLNQSLPPVPASVFAKAGLAYDMMYGKVDTPFLMLAANAGAVTADGLGMLVEQAAEAFFYWRGVRPTTAPVISALRKEALQLNRDQAV